MVEIVFEDVVLLPDNSELMIEDRSRYLQGCHFTFHLVSVVSAISQLHMF